MVTIHIATFLNREGAEIIPQIRENTNLYKFMTICRKQDGKNVSENIYLSKATAKLFELGDTLSAQELKKFSVAEYINDAGEPRTKLTVGASTWLSAADLFV